MRPDKFLDKIKRLEANDGEGGLFQRRQLFRTPVSVAKCCYPITLHLAPMFFARILFTALNALSSLFGHPPTLLHSPISPLAYTYKAARDFIRIVRQVMTGTQ